MLVNENDSDNKNKGNEIKSIKSMNVVYGILYKQYSTP